MLEALLSDKHMLKVDQNTQLTTWLTFLVQPRKNIDREILEISEIKLMP